MIKVSKKPLPLSKTWIHIHTSYPLLSNTWKSLQLRFLFHCQPCTTSGQRASVFNLNTVDNNCTFDDVDKNFRYLPSRFLPMENTVCHQSVLAPSCLPLACPPSTQTFCPFFLYHKTNKRPKEDLACCSSKQRWYHNKQTQRGSGDTPGDTPLCFCSAPNWLFICCCTGTQDWLCRWKWVDTTYNLGHFHSIGRETDTADCSQFALQSCNSVSKYKIAFQDLFVSKTQGSFNYVTNRSCGNIHVPGNRSKQKLSFSLQCRQH